MQPVGTSRIHHTVHAHTLEIALSPSCCLCPLPTPLPLAGAAMPRYYCDYCDTYLTHDSPQVRKQHNAGYKHKANVRNYFMQFEEAQTQSLIDSKIMEFEMKSRQGLQGPPGMAPIMMPRPMGPGQMPPPGLGMPPPGMGMPPPGMPMPGMPPRPGMPQMQPPPGGFRPPQSLPPPGARPPFPMPGGQQPTQGHPQGMPQGQPPPQQLGPSQGYAVPAQ